jgi:hypothetical protein
MAKRGRNRSSVDTRQSWQAAPKYDIAVFDRAVYRLLGIVATQFDLYDRFVKLAALYDPNGWAATTSHLSREMTAARHGTQVIDNVIASNVDSTAGTMGSVDIRAVFPTTGAMWSTQRTMRHLEFYAEELRKHLDQHPKEKQAVHESTLKGTAVCKTDLNAYDEIECTQPQIDDVFVDEGSLQPDGWPMEMFQRHRIDRDELAAQYPKYREQILSAQATRPTGTHSSWWQRWLDDGRLQRNQVGMLEGWHRPVGRKGREGYKPGRHFKAVDGQVILDETYDEHSHPHYQPFPFARLVWTHRYAGWYGIGGAERITGHQRRLNKHNFQFDKQLDHIAHPTTYVGPADANIAVRDFSPLGAVAVVRGPTPHTVIPHAISPEQYQRDKDVYERAFSNFGQSRMAATAMKPAGIESGIALREYKDQSSDRFASQEENVEQFKLRNAWLGLMAAKRLGAKAPKFYRATTYGARKLEWGKVDPGETKVRIQAASVLAHTPAGRKQTVIDLASTGLISQDESRRLLGDPDLERAMSLWTSAIENIERALEDMLDGYVVMPHPMMNLQMCVQRGQQQLNLAEMAEAPEDVLENLRQFVVVAAHFLAGPPPQQPATAPMGVGPAAPQPGALGPAPIDPLQMTGTMPGTPAAQLAPQGMPLMGA